MEDEDEPKIREIQERVKRVTAKYMPLLEKEGIDRGEDSLLLAMGILNDLASASIITLAGRNHEEVREVELRMRDRALQMVKCLNNHVLGEKMETFEAIATTVLVSHAVLGGTIANAERGRDQEAWWNVEEFETEEWWK